MLPKLERRHRATRSHPMRRTGDAPRHHAGFVAHLVAAQIEARGDGMLHNAAQHLGVRIYREIVACSAARAPVPRRTA